MSLKHLQSKSKIKNLKFIVLTLDANHKIKKKPLEYFADLLDPAPLKSIKQTLTTWEQANKDNLKVHTAKFHLLCTDAKNNLQIILLHSKQDPKLINKNLIPLYQSAPYKNLKSALEYIQNHYHMDLNCAIDLSEITQGLLNKNIKQNLIAIAKTQESINYNFQDFKSKNNTNNKNNKNNSHINLHISCAKHKELKQDINSLQIINQAIMLCRNLGNTPPNICDPKYLATTAKNIAKQNNNIKIKVLEKPQLEKLGMNCLLAVGLGSKEQSKLIECQYTHPDCKKSQPIILVGKGVTFDTGGLSMKSPANMLNMHLDMCGAASVLATLQACAQLELKLNLVVMVPTAENMPGSHAFRPSDIITSYCGKTVEIVNTDAEGRLILCDTLSYADEKHKPKAMIDIATLTGAIAIALGQQFTGVFSNNDKLAQELTNSGVDSQDLAWQMPLPPNYSQSLTSNFADISNCGDLFGGSMTAAQYLAMFIGKCENWAHLDIAGTGMTKVGSTGAGVSMLVEYLINQQQA